VFFLSVPAYQQHVLSGYIHL